MLILFVIVFIWAIGASWFLTCISIESMLQKRWPEGAMLSLALVWPLTLLLPAGRDLLLKKNNY